MFIGIVDCKNIGWNIVIGRKGGKDSIGKTRKWVKG